MVSGDWGLDRLPCGRSGQSGMMDGVASLKASGLFLLWHQTPPGSLYGPEKA